MQLIIISGKIGSGKSTLSKCFQKKGYHYINSDSLAKDIIQNNKFIIKKLNKEFDILNNKKMISLKNLKKILLLSEGDKDKINSIIHPFFYKELNLILGKSNYNKIVLELPLIETSNNIKYNFKIVTIETKVKIRKQRYLAKSASKAEDFIILNKYQKSLEYYKKYSDYVISNNDTMGVLQTRFNKLYSKFKE
jgi:dephospho-CoA kinase